MKVVAFNGSPRKDGNTFYILNKVLETIKKEGIETELVQVGGTSIRGCTACYKCAEKKNKRCVIENDILNSCVEKMIASEAIILGSPTYFSDMTSEMKALIDRSGFVARANGGLFRHKIGASVAAVRRGGGTNVFDSMNKMFFMSEMVIPGSTYWNFVFGRDKGEAEKDNEGIANMINLGVNIAWLLKKLKG